MSNFNRESFPGRHNLIEGGPEVVNGTSQVSLAFWDREDHDDPQAQSAMFLMDADEALKLAEWLADHAWEAKRQKWREGHLFSG